MRASCSAGPRSWCCWPVTVHAMAAELLGENVVLLLCVPELVPALLWSSLHLDRPEQHGYHRGHDQIEQKRARRLPRRRGGGRFGYLAASMDEHGVSRCAMTSVSCGVSGLLVYYYVVCSCFVCGRHMARPRPLSLVWRRPSSYSSFGQML